MVNILVIHSLNTVYSISYCANLVKTQKLLTNKIRNYLNDDEAKNLKFAIWCLIDPNNNDLSQICISRSNGILIVKHGNQKLGDEAKLFIDILNEFDVFISKNEDIKSDLIDNFKRYNYNSRINRFFDIGDMSMMKDKRLYDNITIEEIFYEMHNRLFTNGVNDMLEHMRESEEYTNKKNNRDYYLYTNQTTDFIENWLLATMVSRYKYDIHETRETSNTETLIQNHSIAILTRFKFMLSMLFSYNDFNKEIRIPINMTERKYVTPRHRDLSIW